MILPIGRWVIETACATAARWVREKEPGSAHRGERVGSAAQQRAASSVDVARALETTGLPPSALILEITETSLVREPDIAAARLRRAPRARRPPRDRRLRHRVLVAELPPAVPRRHPQDRPLLHRHDQRGRARPAPRAGPAVARAHPRRGDRGRGHRAPGPARAAPGAALRLRSGLPLRAAAR